MINLSRLEATYPKLADSFQRAPLSKKHQAIRVACDYVISQTGLGREENEIKVAFDALFKGQSLDLKLRERLEELEAHFDDRYLTLLEEGDKSKTAERLQLFARARVTSALMIALTEESSELQESLYEALIALDGPEDLIRLVEKILS